MPKIQKIFEIDVTPEKFLNACSAVELQEVVYLLESQKYQQKIQQHLHEHITKS